MRIPRYKYVIFTEDDALVGLASTVFRASTNAFCLSGSGDITNASTKIAKTRSE